MKDKGVFGSGRAIGDDNTQIAVRRPFDSATSQPIGATGFLDERYPERPSTLRAKWRRTLNTLKPQTPSGVGADPGPSNTAR